VIDNDGNIHLFVYDKAGNYRLNTLVKHFKNIAGGNEWKMETVLLRKEKFQLFQFKQGLQSNEVLVATFQKMIMKTIS
jgi:hypothetical protein